MNTSTFIISYTQGDRCVTLSNPVRFWEPRRYSSKDAAEAAIAEFKKEAPGFMKFKVLTAR